ncbi:MAG: hypothetical protein ACR2O0_10700 [Rhizobiaceae bacterium]
MGRLGFPVQQGVWVRKPKIKPEFVIVDGMDPKQESTLDKFLAYTSFYVLLFAAFCAFLPAQTGTAFAYVKELSPMATPKRDYLLRHAGTEAAGKPRWQLRGTYELYIRPLNSD